MVQLKAASSTFCSIFKFNLNLSMFRQTNFLHNFFPDIVQRALKKHFKHQVGNKMIKFYFSSLKFPNKRL